MFEKAFMLEIVTPERMVFKDEATSLSAPGVKGGFQVLYNHAPFLSAIDIGEIKVKDKQGRDSIYATSGGFVEVDNNHVVVLAETCELGSEIDVERAKAAKERAVRRLRGKEPATDIDRARVALLRATNRLRLAGKR